MAEESSEIFCRICYSDINPITKKNDLISPCNCSGSVKYVHYACLKMWRIKGKNFSNIRKCEQCQGFYNISGEKPLHTVVVSLVTVLAVLCAYLAAVLFFKNIFEAIATIIEEFSNERYVESDRELVRFDKTYHLSCVMLSITLYKLFTTPKLFAIFNYIFTFWRLIHFNFTIDKMLFFIFSMYFLREIYKEMYTKIDGLYYYIMNMNWLDQEIK